MTRTAIVVRHIHFEHAGLIGEVLDEAGFAVSYLEAGRDDLSPARFADLLVVMGAPLDVADQGEFPFLGEEIALLTARLASDRPTLGICLGSQLMAAALGARVYPADRPEVGWAPVTLTPDGMAGPMAALDGVPILHWHGDTYDLPAGTQRLASSHVCPNQAFTRGRNILALQFHPEVRGEDFEDWLIANIAHLKSLGVSPSALRDQARRYAPDLKPAALAFFRDWVEGLEIAP